MAVSLQPVGQMLLFWHYSGSELMALFEYDAFRGLFVSVWLKFGQ
jgi:hypothetical protein